MATINFVPNDYVQQKQSTRANYLYLVLLAAVLGAIGVTFSILKMRLHGVESELAVLNGQMKEAEEQIAQMEELKARRQTQMKVMMTTALLLEPVPRSILLAALTNNLPDGVSLLNLKMEEKETARIVAAPAPKGGGQTQYQKTGAAAPAADNETPQTEVTLELEGIAPSDIEVASFIANLSTSILLQKVQLVESREKEIDKVKYREFRLKAELIPDLKLTKEDVDTIRSKTNETI